MKNKIIKLARRLGNFTIDDIEPLLQCEKAEIKNIISELVNAGLIEKFGKNYVFKKETPKKLPYIFQITTKEDIRILITGFCIEISSIKIIYITKAQETLAQHFYTYFRTIIFDNQLSELQQFFEQNPKQPFLRKFFDKIFYFYQYSDKTFVAEKPLKSKIYNKHSTEEQLKFKVVYSYLTRKINANYLKHKTILHLSEHIWRRCKEYKNLINEIKFLLSINFL